VLGHREIDPERARQVDQRMIVSAVRNVLDDGLASIEASVRFGCGFLGEFLNKNRT